jgi:hypothetical protein
VSLKNSKNSFWRKLTWNDVNDQSLLELKLDFHTTPFGCGTRGGIARPAALRSFLWIVVAASGRLCF